MACLFTHKHASGGIISISYESNFLPEMTDRMRIETNHLQGENWWENVKAGGGAGLKPRDGDEGREDVVSLMRVLNGKNAHKNTIPRLLKNNSVPKNFRGISGTGEDTIRYRTQVLEVMEELEEISSKIDVNSRKDPDNFGWKQLQNKVADITGLDADAWAVAFDADREQKAKDAAAVNVANTPEPVAVVEKSVWYTGMAKDIEILAKGPRSKKKLTDPVQISSAILHNIRFSEAKQNMESSGISLGKDECEYVVAILTLAGAKSEEIGKEDLSSAIELLRSRNVDVPSLMLELGVDEEQMMDGLSAKGGTRGVDIEGRIKSIVESTKDLDNTLNDLARLRSNVAREVSTGSASARADLEKIDAKIDEFVYKKAEQMRKSGDSGVDPLTVEVNEPILGHLEQFRVNVGNQGNREVRVLSKENAFNGERIEELIMVQLEKAMKSFNATVEEGSKPNLGELETALNVIERRKKSLELLFAERKTPNSQDKQFLSMEVGEKIGLRTLELSEILKNKGIDLTKMDDGVTYTPEELIAIKSLPEYKALIEMRNIEDWVSAQMSVLGYLNTVRLKGKGDKLESLAALGADGTITIPTDAIIGIWTMNRIGKKRSETQGTELSDYYERACDIEDAICEISIGDSIPIGSIEINYSGAGRLRNRIGELVTRHLMDVDEVTVGGWPKNDFTFLNRYATSLSGQRLARYETFVKLLMKDENYGLLTGDFSDAEYKRKMAELDKQITKEISIAESFAREGKPLIHEGEDRFVAFSYANEVAMSHALGESDKRSLKRVWRVAIPDEKLSYGGVLGVTVDGTRRVGYLVPGSYPASSAAAGVEHFAHAIMALKRRFKVIVPPTLVPSIENGWLEPSLAKTFLENTNVKIDTKLVTLESLRNEGKSYVEIAKLLKTQSQPGAHGAYLKQLSGSIALRDLLTCAKKEDISAILSDTFYKKVAEIVAESLGVDYGDPKKKKLVDGVNAAIWSGLYGMYTGIVSDLTGEADQDLSGIAKMQNDISQGSRAEANRIALPLARLMNASVIRVGDGFVEKPGAPLSIESWRQFKRMIEPSYKRLTGGYGMSKIGILRSTRPLHGFEGDFWDSLN